MGGDEAELERHDVDEYRQEWESPKHEVNITKRFGITPTEVTREMFAAFVQDTGYATAPKWNWFPRTARDHRANIFDVSRGGYLAGARHPQDSDKHPVVHVSRADAEAFAEWLSAKTGQTWRLPPEVEWEYAARAGTDSASFLGQDVNDGAEYTAEVGSYKPNAWGLYGMTGNAREWVSDYWEPNLESGPNDEQPRTAGVSTFPVLRGGAWDYMPENLRIAYRSAYYNNYIHSTMWGFRLVREL